MLDRSSVVVHHPQAVGLLRNLAASPALRPHVARAGAVKLLSKLLLQPSLTEALAECTCGALLNLAQDDEAVRQRVTGYEASAIFESRCCW